jgi:hypothetical protein
VKRTTVRRADKDLWRVVELDGGLVRSWLPGIEADDRDGPLDRGGFDRYSDAWAFSLGVDHERAFHGHLTGITAMDIDVEREALDRRCTAPTMATPEPQADPESPRHDDEVTDGPMVPPQLHRPSVPPKVYTEADAFWDDLEIELRVLRHRVA